MRQDDLGLLLADAVRLAERDAPTVDPLRALASTRERRRDRRGYVAMLAFVVFALLVQADSRVAHGEMASTSLAAGAATAAPAAHG